MRLIRMVAGLTWMVVASCHARKPAAAAGPEAGATLTVENQGFTDMTIYAVSGTTGRVRLGQVTGNTTQRLSVPGYLVQSGGTLRFVADPIGGSRRPVSDELLVSPGDSLTLTIPPQ
ncbi:MAG TPA: hypothetical protein VH763_12815 [Gemmatimonadales bacterium]